MKTRFLALCLLLAWMSAPASAGDLRVRLSGVGEATGSLRVALFANAADFEAGSQTAGHFTPARAEGVEVVFANLPPGRYGLSTFHDVNANGELDSNLVGMPTEPFGFSRNARGRFGPPTFDELAFEMGEDDLVLEVELQ